MRKRLSHLDTNWTVALIGVVLMGIAMGPALSMPVGGCSSGHAQADADCCGGDDCSCCCHTDSPHENEANQSRDTEPDEHDCPCHDLLITQSVPLMIAGEITAFMIPQPRAIHHAADDTLPSGDWRLPIFHPPS